MEAFKFDQEERHTAFWDYVRENKWDIVEGFIDSKVGNENVSVIGRPLLIVKCLIFLSSLMFAITGCSVY